MCIIYLQYFIMIMSSCMIYNHVILHDMDTVCLFFSSLLSDFGKDTVLIQSGFGNSQSIYGYHYRLGCVVWWATWCKQTNSISALTALKKPNEVHTRVGFMCTYAQVRTQISTFWQAISLTVHILLHCLVKSPPLQSHTCSATRLSMSSTKKKNLSTNICFQQKPH